MVARTGPNTPRIFYIKYCDIGVTKYMQHRSSTAHASPTKVLLFTLRNTVVVGLVLLLHMETDRWITNNGSGICVVFSIFRKIVSFVCGLLRNTEYEESVPRGCWRAASVYCCLPLPVFVAPGASMVCFM